MTSEENNNNNNYETKEEIKKDMKDTINQEEKIEKTKKLLKKREENIREEIIDIVIRQTTYNREEAIKNLEQNNFDFSKVIRNFLNPNPIKNPNEDIKKINIQQEIYKEIRNMMDSASRKQRQIAESKKN